MTSSLHDLRIVLDSIAASLPAVPRSHWLAPRLRQPSHRRGATSHLRMFAQHTTWRAHTVTTGNYPPGGTWEIDNGWDVITSDGEKLGDVEEVHPHYLVVGKGFIFHSERYVPVSTITSVVDEKVHISVSKDEVGD